VPDHVIAQLPNACMCVCVCVCLSEGAGGGGGAAQDGRDAVAQGRHPGTARADRQRADARTHALPGPRRRVPHSSQHGRHLLPGPCQGLTHLVAVSLGFLVVLRKQSEQMPWLSELLHCALSCGAVCCNRTCLSVCLFVCLWVCYHDNSKLRASIFTKLGL